MMSNFTKLFAVGASEALKIIKAGPSPKTIAIAAEKVAKAAEKIARAAAKAR